MFRLGRWRSEKHKVKASFKLHFHATQVSQWDSETLVVWVVEGEVGKATARLEEGVVKDGSCRWELPVQERVKFSRDSKSGKINPKTYRFIVCSKRSGENGYVGEVSIDFADYAEATKACTVSLPFKNSKCNGFLHVMIQRLQETADQGKVEEREDKNTKSKDTLSILLSDDKPDDAMKSHPNGDGPLLSKTQSAELVHDRRGSSGSDITMSNSDCSSGFNTPREVGLRSNTLQDSSSFLSSYLSAAPYKQTENSSETTDAEHQPSKWGGTVDSDHGTTTYDSTISSQSSLIKQRSVEASDIEMENLKLARQLELLDLELQTLRKQIVKESKRGQELLKELTDLKEERDVLRAECRELNSFRVHIEDTRCKSKLHFDNVDAGVLLEVIRQELNYEKDLTAKLRFQLQKTQESNAGLILAMKDLEEMLEGKRKEVPDLTDKLVPTDADIRGESDKDEVQRALEELTREQTDAQQTYFLEQKIVDLYGDIKIYKRDKDEVEMQMEQLALDYEILKQENHEMSRKLEQIRLLEQLKMQCECSSSFTSVNELEAIESLEIELKKQSEAYSASLARISRLEAHIKDLEEEMEKRAKNFEADLEVLTQAKVEQEQRAILAEETLQKMRWNNAITAEKLQEELRRLSTQMASTFDANEQMAMNAVAEANEFRLKISQLDEMLKKSNEELQSLRGDYEVKLQVLSDQLILKTSRIERISAETEDKSKKLECQKKHEEQIVAAFSEEILKLKSELERLIIENKLLSQAEQTKNTETQLESLKQLIEQSGSQVERGGAERNESMNTTASMDDAERSIEELNRIRSLKFKNESAVGLLRAEVETLKAECSNLQHSLLDDEAEKENIRKEVVQLKSGNLEEDVHTGADAIHLVKR